MNRDQLAEPYKAFFESTPAGQYFMKELDRMRRYHHEQAEEHPENARDHAQAAKAIRDVTQHITGMGIEVKRGRAMSN